MDSSHYTLHCGRVKPDWPLTGIKVLKAVALQQETGAGASRNTVPVFSCENQTQNRGNNLPKRNRVLKADVVNVKFKHMKSNLQTCKNYVTQLSH